MKHYATGHHEGDASASHKGRTYDCACGFTSPDKNERNNHIHEERWRARQEQLERIRESDYDARAGTQ